MVMGIMRTSYQEPMMARLPTSRGSTKKAACLSTVYTMPASSPCQTWIRLNNNRMNETEGNERLGLPGPGRR